MLKLIINAGKEESFSTLEETWKCLNFVYISLRDQHHDILQWCLKLDDGYTHYEALPAISWYAIAKTHEHFEAWLSFQLYYMAKINTKHPPIFFR